MKTVQYGYNQYKLRKLQALSDVISSFVMYFQSKLYNVFISQNKTHKSWKLAQFVKPLHSDIGVLSFYHNFIFLKNELFGQLHFH